jgi:hypothetical protein
VPITVSATSNAEKFHVELGVFIKKSLGLVSKELVQDSVKTVIQKKPVKSLEWTGYLNFGAWIIIFSILMMQSFVLFRLMLSIEQLNAKLAQLS